MSETQRTGRHGPSTYDGQSQTDASQQVGWFNEKINSIPDIGRELLENYSRIPHDEVLSHVQRIRDKAWAVWSYACIGQVRFLSYSLAQQPYYGPVLEKLRGSKEATFVDAGCCFGQVLRFLTHVDKIAGEQLYGFDLEQSFTDFGYELFCDRDRFAATMLTGDLLAAAGSPAAGQLDSIQGKMDVVHVASVLHCWGWDDMVVAAKRLVALSRPVPGSLIVGTQLGSFNAGEYPMPTGSGHNYRHDVQSMKRFWDQVGRETGTSWAVEAGMFESNAIRDNRGHSWAKADPGMAMIWFMVTRL